MLSDKTKLQMIFILEKSLLITRERNHCYYQSWLCGKGVYVVGSKDTIKVRLLQFIQTLLICANN